MKAVIVFCKALLILIACAGSVCSAPVTSGLKGWFRPESMTLNGSNQITSWSDSSGTGNNLNVWSGVGIPTAVGINGYRYADMANAQSYSKFYTGTSNSVSAATGMNATEFEVFVVASNWASGDLGTISPDPLGSNNEKVSFGISSPGWVNVWGGSSYTGLGSCHQGGVLYNSKGTCLAHQTSLPSDKFIYEGVFGSAGTDLRTIINQVESTQSVAQAPTWLGVSPAAFGAVSRGILVGWNISKLSGRLYEVLIYNRKLTETEREQVYTYLNDKYASPVTDGLKGWYKPESMNLNGSNQITSWSDGSGTSNNLSVWSGTAIPTGVGINGYRYADMINAQSYSKFYTGTGNVVSNATGMNSTAFDVFVVGADYRSGDLGAIGPDPLNSNSDKACFGLYGSGWVNVWGGSGYYGLGTAHQGGTLYNSRGTCRFHQSPTAVDGYTYEGIFGTTGSDTDTLIDGLPSSYDIQEAPSWCQTAPASFGAVGRGVLVGHNISKLSGQLYEVLIYNKKLSDDERTKVYNYLNSKYNLGPDGRMPKSYSIEGNVSLLDFSGNITQVPITIKMCGMNVTEDTVYLDSSGRFMLTDIEPGVYDMWIKASHWLTAQRTSVVVTRDTVISSVSLTNGDCNGDNVVNSTDANNLIDLNGDGAVNGTDSAIVTANLGLSGATPLSTTYVYYVATNGNDNNAGTLTAPFATIERARNAIRTVRSDNKQAHIILRGGTYTLSAVIELYNNVDCNDSYLTIEPYPGEAVTINGGRSVTGWTTYQGSIKQASISGLGLPDYNFLQLYYKGNRQPIAQVPNFNSTYPRRGGFAYTTSTFSGNTTQLYYDSAVINPTGWANPTLAIVDWFPSWNYYNARSSVTSVDTVNHMIQVAQGYDEIWQGDRFRVLKVFEELNAAGEWYCNPSTGVLYFWPPDGDIQTASTIVPALDTMFMIYAVPGSGRYVTNLRISGLAVENCRDAAITVQGAFNCSIMASAFRNVGNVVDLNLDSLYCRISGCDITQTGGAAIVGGSNVGEHSRCANHIIDNNYIYDWGWVDKAYGAIELNDVSRFTITHNRIHDGPRSGIVMNACQFMTAAYNDIHHVNNETEDTGIITTGNSWGGWSTWLSEQNNRLCRGNTIHDNLLHDAQGYGKDANRVWHFPYYSQGIYLDKSSSGFHVHDNVAYNGCDGLYFFGGGSDNICENNVFADGTKGQACTVAYGDYTMTRNKVRKNVFSYANANSYYYYSYNYSAGQILFSYNNVYNNGYAINPSVTGATTWAQWTGLGQDSGSSTSDPQFVDRANHDYRLQPGSPALGLGIHSINIGDAGLYESRARYTWPCDEEYVYRE
ncbi:MAG: right-handed parallel beta-helix repeat-containing protein [Armatimonadota bacterium]